MRMTTNSIYFDLNHSKILKNFNFYITSTNSYSGIEKKLKKTGIDYHYYFFQNGKDSKTIIVSKNTISSDKINKISPSQMKSSSSVVPYWAIITLIIKEDFLGVKKGGLNRILRLNKETQSKNGNYSLSFQNLRFFLKKGKGARGADRLSLNLSLKNFYIKNDEEDSIKNNVFRKLTPSKDENYLFDSDIKGLNDSSFTSSDRNNFLEYGSRDNFNLSKSKLLTDVLNFIKKSEYFLTKEFEPSNVINEQSNKKISKKFKEEKLAYYINNELGGVSVLVNDHVENLIIEKNELETFSNICNKCQIRFNGFFKKLSDAKKQHPQSALINLTKERDKIGKPKEREEFDRIDRYHDSPEVVQNLTIKKFKDLIWGTGGAEALLYKLLSEIFIKKEVSAEKLNLDRIVIDHALFFLKKRNKKDSCFDMYGVVLKSGELNFIKNEKIASPFGIEKYNHSFVEIDNKKYLIERSRIRNIIPNEPLLEQYDLLDNPHPSFLKIQKEITHLLNKGLDDSLIDIKELDKLCKTKIKDIKTTFKDGDLRKRYNSIIDELNNNYGCDIEKIKRFNPEKSKNTVPNTTRLNAFVDQGDFYYKTSHFSLKDYKIPTNAEYISVINGAEIKDKIISIIESAIYNYTYNKEGKIVDSTNNFSDLLKYLNEYFFKRDENKLRI